MWKIHTEDEPNKLLCDLEVSVDTRNEQFHYSLALCSNHGLWVKADAVACHATCQSTSKSRQISVTCTEYR